jgi:serine phosphatase RsbU (regulator of sigma subunit)
VRHRSSLWFKTATAVGAGIAVFLFVDTVLAYRYVNSRFARDQGMLQAVEEVSSLEHELRRQRVDTLDGLRRVLTESREDRSDEIAWISVLTDHGQVAASSGTVEPHAMPPLDRISAVIEGRERYSAVQNASGAEILIALLPMKQRFQWQAPPDASGDGSMVEVGIYLQETEGILHPLGRNLLISTIAAISLLASMIVFLLRLPAYVHGRALENQVQLARGVQQKLLPETGGGSIEFAGECVPADEVGGDFYDVFRTDAGETVLVLADVSGKGLPAAIRMGIVHGAIRALSSAKGDSGVARMAERLNEQLREGTSREFVTLFWAFYNPQRHDLCYVNAGHLPPLLVASTSGELRRLETGGPVLGLLPKASYQEECINLNGDETLIAYSDGLLEATSRAGEEFGESRLLPVVQASIGKSARAILRGVMEEASGFMEGGVFHDDLTVLVAKLAQEPVKLNTKS